MSVLTALFTPITGYVNNSSVLFSPGQWQLPSCFLEMSDKVVHFNIRSGSSQRVSFGSIHIQCGMPFAVYPPCWLISYLQVLAILVKWNTSFKEKLIVASCHRRCFRLITFCSTWPAALQVTTPQ